MWFFNTFKYDQKLHFRKKIFFDTPFLINLLIQSRIRDNLFAFLIKNTTVGGVVMEILSIQWAKKKNLVDKIENCIIFFIC